MSTETAGKCCCVTDVECEAPANTPDHVVVRTKCWSCGDFVCKACSRVRRWRYARGRVRICDNCAEALGGGEKP